MVSDAPSKDVARNIIAEDIKKSENGKFDLMGIEKLFAPEVSFINFDDFIIGNNNSTIIAPSRYPGVSFYSPYNNNNTWLTYTFRNSSPNSLIVGYMLPPDPQGNSYIASSDQMVIDFAQPAKDVTFLWGNQFGQYNSGQIRIYSDNNQLVATVGVGVGNYWTNIALSQYSQRIKRLILIRPPVNDATFGHIHLDNFQYNTVTTASPIGFLDGVNIQQGVALGWSRDPDNPSASNSVDCYVDGTGQTAFIGRVVANLASPDLPPPGSHRFSMPVPMNFRDGNNHQMYCYGLDVTGGDPPFLLSGSPKTFKFNPPTGNLDLVTTPDGEAKGWSTDPDLPNQPNRVHFYINAPAGSPGAIFAGETIANIPRSDVGNHGFSYSIPPQFRDGVPHNIYAYGIDLTGDQSKPLGGNPKTFTLSPQVQSVAFDAINNQIVNGQLTSSEVDIPTHGYYSQRIFPDKKNPNDTVNHKQLQVKAVVGRPNITVYFKNYDVDDPSGNSIIDDNGNDGNDNHEGRTVGGVYPPFARGNLSSPSAVTNSEGDAIVYFTVTSHAGDNFRVEIGRAHV